MINPGDLQNRAVILMRADAAGPPLDTPLNTLTTKQRSVLLAISRYETATGEPCPATWLARHLHLHHSSVQRHVYLLHRKGWLRSPHAPSSLSHQIE